MAHATKNYINFDDTENWSREVCGNAANLYANAVHKIGHNTYFKGNQRCWVRSAHDIAASLKLKDYEDQFVISIFVCGALKIYMDAKKNLP